jgi:hypothetical protein
MNNKRSVELRYKCGCKVKANILLSRLELEAEFAATALCPECWEVQKWKR